MALSERGAVRAEGVRRRAVALVRSDALAPAWLLLGIRAVFWAGAALALIWSPTAVAGGELAFRAYDGWSDLFFGTFARWDAGWFVHIADHGYDSRQAAAFFPLYPLVVHVVSTVTGSTVVAGVLVSLVAAGAAAWVLAELARPLLGDRGARESVLLVALYPLAFVFTAVFSDALFLALSAGAFLAASRGRPWVAGGLGALAVLTRALGLALIPALVLLLWRRDRPWRLAPLLALPGAFGAFALYLERKLGDWNVFADAQSEFWSRHTPTLGPLGGLWESAESARHGAAQLLLHLPRTGETYDRFDQIAVWFVLHFVLLLAAFWLTWVAWGRLGPAYGLYSLTTLAILLTSPSTWFPLQSLPRYLLADFPLFLALAALTLDHPRARQVVLLSFAAVGGIAAVAFAQHVWVA